MVDKQNKEDEKAEETLCFQLIGEIKGFIVQYIAHGESRPVVIAAGHKQRLKVCAGLCMCA